MDNLRRSLVPAISTLLLMMGWIAMPDAWFWTMVVIAMLAIPAAIPVLTDLLKKPAEVAWRQQVISSARSAKRHFGQVLFTLACLPYEAYFSLDAIIRTHVRLFITHRRLLEWNPSREVERASGLVDLTKGRSGIFAFFPANVDCARYCDSWARRNNCDGAFRTDCRTADIVVMGRFSGRCLAHKPAASSEERGAVGWANKFFASRFTQDMVLLRNFHRSGRSLASAR